MDRSVDEDGIGPFVAQTVGGFLTACFCLAVTVPAAELMYRVIEGPAMEYGRRLLQRPAPATAADSPRRDL